MDLEKVIQLFTGPNSEDLYDRHLAAIERLCKNNVGFPIRDLPKVQQILEITLRLLLKGVSSFLQPAVDLIRVLTKPFVKKTATDEFRLLGNISSILACVSQILANSAYPQDLQLAASEMLIVFASGYGQRPSLLDKASPAEQVDSGARSRQYHTNQMLISSSGALVTVVQSLAKAVAAYDEVLMMALTLVATQISYFPDNAVALLDAGLLQSLPHLLSYDYRHPLTPVAVQLLWNLLDFAPAATRIGLVSTPAPQSYPGPFSGTTTQGRASAENVQGSAEQGSSPQQQPADEQGSPRREEGRAPSPPRAPSPSRTAEQQQQQQQGRSGTGGFPKPTLSLLESRPTKSTLRRISNSPPVSILPAVATSLTSLFLANLLHGCRAVDKELRNDLVVVCSLIIGSDHPEPASALPTSQGSKSASSPQEEAELLQLCSMEFIEAARAVGFFEALLAVATSPELGLQEHEGLVKAWALSTEDLDYELRQLAWRAVVAGCVHAGPGDAWLLLDAVRAWSLVRVLLAFIEEVPEAAPHPALAGAALSAQRRWSSDQMDTLRAMALARLHALAPLCPEVYVEEGGPSVLLRFLSNSVHAAHMEGALRHLHNLVGPRANVRSFSEDGGMEEVLGSAGAMGVLMGLLKDGSRPENVHHCCLLLLASLCRMGGVDTATRLRSMIGEASLRSPTRGSMASQQGTRRTSNTNISIQGTRRRASLVGGDVEPSVSNLRRFRHEGGVDVVLAQLARCQSADKTLPSAYTIAVLDVVWTCVVPDRKNTARFLVEDGLDALLTLLEVGNRGHRAVGLSLLADILTNPRSHSFFHEWRSHQDQSTAAHLLLRIWKEEDTASGISDKQGILTSTSLPLRGTGKPATWVAPEAIAYGNLLPKGNAAGAATQHLGASTGPLTGVRVASPAGGGATARLVPAPHMQLHATSPHTTQPALDASIRTTSPLRSTSPLSRSSAPHHMKNTTAAPPAANGTMNDQTQLSTAAGSQQQQGGAAHSGQGIQGGQGVLTGRGSGGPTGLGVGGLTTERSSMGGWQSHGLATERSSQRLSREGTESVLGGVVDAGQQAALVQGLEGRGAKVAAMLAASSGEPLLAKVYSCFNLLGFGNFDYLPPADGILLTLVEKYVKFKQGEMWVAIANNFEASGVRPTAPDRERLVSGIELSEHLAAAVRDAQLAMLGREAEVAAQKEAKFYEDMRAQRKLEQESRFFKQDKSQLSLAEIRQAKEKKETMLRNSIRDFRMSPLTVEDD